jgi:Ca-activated chloride channel family protein
MADFQTRLETTRGQPIMLKGLRVEGDLRGLLFEARAELRFANPGDTNIELFYAFPVPWGAVLLGVDVQLGDKRLTGTVIPKRHAEAEYDDALADGDAAIMVERVADNTYRVNLGNLMPGEACAISVRYAQKLRFEQGGVRMLIPTVIAPRYGNPLTEGGLQPHQVPSHDLLAEYPFDITLRLHGDLAAARVVSPSHPVSVAHQGEGAQRITVVNLARHGALDRDFVLVADQLAHGSLAMLGQDQVLAARHAGAVAALASFCPRIGDASVEDPLAVKLLVDCSGSMAGDSIAAARRALHAVVAQLGERDRFSLSRFGDQVEHRSRALWKATDPTRMAAARWVDALDANLGGTKMRSALDSVFALGHGGDTDVLLVTDGQVYGIDAIVASARASGHRVFAVGIGSSPAESNLRRLAEATGGACDFVAPGEAVEPAVLRMFARLRTPRVTDLQVRWPEGMVPVWQAEIPKSVFDGDTVNVLAQLPGAADGAVRLMGRRGADGALEEIARAELQGGVAADDTLCRTAAWVRTGAGDPAEAAVEETVAYRLVTQQTHFLLVHVRAEGEKAGDMPVMHKLPQMMAAGWGGAGMVAASMARQADEVHDMLAVPAFRSSRGAPPALQRLSAGLRGGSASLSWNGDGSADAYRIPDFLRADLSQVAPEAPRPHLAVDAGNPNHMSLSGDYIGLTPLGLSVWLNTRAREQWPRTLAGLRKAGVGGPVVDWLELVVAQGAPDGTDKRDLVETYVCLLAARETFEALLASAAEPAGVGRFPSGFTNGLPDLAALLGATGRAPEIQALVAHLRQGLAGMRAEAWPAQVFAMEMGGVGA